MNVIVVGGGAAGFFAAIHHQTAHPRDQVIIIEKSANLLNKVKVSGGGDAMSPMPVLHPTSCVHFTPGVEKPYWGPFTDFNPGTPWPGSNRAGCP